MSREPTIRGQVAAGFERVREVFIENFTRRGEVGAAFCARVNGETVVDLAGGLADTATRTPWERDTMGIIFSATKGVVAACFLMLVERGQADLDAPVATYWPEFGCAGKEAITLRQILNHRAGLCAIDAPLTIEDFTTRPEVVQRALAEQAPCWPPGEGQGYHGFTYGPYASEIFRRLEGRTLGRFIAEEIAGPLSADVYLGLPESLDDRVATIYTQTFLQRVLKSLPRVLFKNSVERRILKAFIRRRSYTARAFANPAELGPKGLQNYNLPKVRRLELAWANGIASARGLAAIYEAVIDGSGRLIRPETLDQVLPRQSFEWDNVLHKPIGWSLGFVKEEPHLFSPNSEAIGHPGAGGALGLADPTHGLAIGYVMNKMDGRLRSPRCLALCHAVYEVLGEAAP